MTLTFRSMLLAATVMFTFAAGDVVATNSNNQNKSSNTTNNITNHGGQGGHGGSAIAGASATAGAAASARQGQIQGQIQGQHQSIQNSGNATINNNVPANTTNETRFSGSYTVRNTPDVYAPAIAGGANPCVVGVSAGGAVAGFGLSFGMTRNDDGCERRNTAALLYNMGERDVAQELLCETASVRAARLRTGRPCAEDRAAPAQTSAAPSTTPAVAQTSSNPVAVTPAAARSSALRNGSPAGLPELNSFSGGN